MNCGHIDHKGRACVRSFHLGPHVYTRLSQLGARKKRSAGAEREFKAVMVERCDGWCEARSVIQALRPSTVYPEELELYRYELMRQVCGTIILHPGRDAHHRWPEDRDYNRHDPERGLYVCAASHAWTHDHPVRAHEIGLLR